RLKKASKSASYLSVSIETGRTHQIRKHLASIGHPVLGDQYYGAGRKAPQSERLIGRQMLHAAEIEFTNPISDLPVRAKAPMPADLKDCLQQYRLN
ncbi:RluA family pseudouridine synthase, partial [Verrucomicrobiota bacterium]